jgi:hypothetical protein
MWGRHSAVGIATQYGLYGSGFESRWGGRDFLFNTLILTVPGANPASCIISIRVLFRGKAAEARR